MKCDTNDFFMWLNRTFKIARAQTSVALRVVLLQRCPSCKNNADEEETGAEELNEKKDEKAKMPKTGKRERDVLLGGYQEQKSRIALVK